MSIAENRRARFDYHIEERHEELDVISPGSPLGSALLGRAVGHRVEYHAPNGNLTVEILAVEVG